MLLHGDVGIQVVEGAVGLVAAPPFTCVDALNLVIAATGAFLGCGASQGDKLQLLVLRGRQADSHVARRRLVKRTVASGEAADELARAVDVAARDVAGLVPTGVDKRACTGQRAVHVAGRESVACLGTAHAGGRGAHARHTRVVAGGACTCADGSVRDTGRGRGRLPRARGVAAGDIVGVDGRMCAVLAHAGREGVLEAVFLLLGIHVVEGA